MILEQGARPSQAGGIDADPSMAGAHQRGAGRLGARQVGGRDRGLVDAGLPLDEGLLAELGGAVVLGRLGGDTTHLDAGAHEVFGSEQFDAES